MFKFDLETGNMGYHQAFQTLLTKTITVELIV